MMFSTPGFRPHIDGDFLRQVPVATAVVTSGDLRTGREVAGHEIALSVRSFQVRPRLHARLTPSLPSVPTSRARASLPRRRNEVIDHRVDGVFQFQNLAAHVHGDFLGQVTGGHGGGDVGDVRTWSVRCRPSS